MLYDRLDPLRRRSSLTSHLPLDHSQPQTTQQQQQQDDHDLLHHNNDLLRRYSINYTTGNLFEDDNVSIALFDMKDDEALNYTRLEGDAVTNVCTVSQDEMKDQVDEDLLPFDLEWLVPEEEEEEDDDTLEHDHESVTHPTDFMPTTFKEVSDKKDINLYHQYQNVDLPTPTTGCHYLPSRSQGYGSCWSPIPYKPESFTRYSPYDIRYNAFLQLAATSSGTRTLSHCYDKLLQSMKRTMKTQTQLRKYKMSMKQIKIVDKDVVQELMYCIQDTRKSRERVRNMILGKH